MKSSVAFCIAVVLISALIAKTSCKNDANSAPRLAKGDTSRILGLYCDIKGKDIRHEVLYRVINEFVNVDSATKKLSWKMDSFYYAPRLDSLRDSITMKPILDSLGKARVETKWDFTPKHLIWDSGIKIDSALSRFRKYLEVKPDTTNKAQAIPPAQ